MEQFLPSPTTEFNLPRPAVSQPHGEASFSFTLSTFWKYTLTGSKTLLVIKATVALESFLIYYTQHCSTHNTSAFFGFRHPWLTFHGHPAVLMLSPGLLCRQRRRDGVWHFTWRIIWWSGWGRGCVALEKNKIKSSCILNVLRCFMACQTWVWFVMHCLISWMTSAHVHVCVQGLGTHTQTHKHTASVKPAIIWIPPLWWLRKTSQSPSCCQRK